VEISSQTAEDVCLIELGGEVDERTAPQVSEAIESAVVTGVRAVVLDLCSVTFMDSRGLWALIRARRALSRRNVSFSLACLPHSEAGRLLELTGLATAFDVHASGAEALDAMLGPGRTKLEDSVRVSADELEQIEKRLEAMLDDLQARSPLVPPDAEATG
jgi:anti-sigma B factor antagonist